MFFFFVCFLTFMRKHVSWIKKECFHGCVLKRSLYLVFMPPFHKLHAACNLSHNSWPIKSSLAVPQSFPGFAFLWITGSRESLITVAWNERCLPCPIKANALKEILTGSELLWAWRVFIVLHGSISVLWTALQGLQGEEWIWWTSCLWWVETQGFNEKENLTKVFLTKRICLIRQLMT